MVAVVDDDEPVCRALGRLFRSAGYGVQTFTSGAAFLASCASRRPDCLVLDLEMPEISGPELMSRLAASAVRIPTVVITGSTDTNLTARAVQAGAIAVLRKPTDGGQALLDAVEAAIRRNRS